MYQQTSKKRCIFTATPSEIKPRCLSEPNKLETRVNFLIAGNGGVRAWLIEKNDRDKY